MNLPTLAITLSLIIGVLQTTPQPTKTTTITSTPTPTESVITSSTAPRTLTQSDLSVITGNVQRPNGIVWHEDKLYVICNGDWTIYTIDDTSGSTETYIYGVRNGHSLYAETNEAGDLTLWVPDSQTNQLLAVNPVRAPQPIASNLNAPWGIAYFDENSFLITSQNDDSILKVSRAGEVETLLEGLRSPTGIASDDSLVYVANSGSARRAIEWFDSEAKEITLKPLVSGLQNTTGITLSEDGYLYFTYALGTRGIVGRVDAEYCREKGGCNNDEVQIIVYTELAAPLAGLTISPDNRLFVHTMFRPEIYWVQLQG